MAASGQARADQAVPTGARDGVNAQDLARWQAKVVVVLAPLGSGMTEMCWRWTGAKDRKGYGKFWVRGFPGIDGKPRRDAGQSGGMVMAHRFGLWAYRGVVAAGKHVDHLCRRVSCVNPWHLQVLEPAVNTANGNRDRGLDWTAAIDDPFDFLEEFRP